MKGFGKLFRGFSTDCNWSCVCVLARGRTIRHAQKNTIIGSGGMRRGDYRGVKEGDVAGGNHQGGDWGEGREEALVSFFGCIFYCFSINNRVISVAFYLILSHFPD